MALSGAVVVEDIDPASVSSCGFGWFMRRASETFFEVDGQYGFFPDPAPLDLAS